MSEDSSKPQPMKLFNRIHAVVAECERNGLDEKYCVYCYENLTIGSWQYICKYCVIKVMDGTYSVPATWIKDVEEKIKRGINARITSTSTEDI